MATSRTNGHTHNGNPQSSREVHQEINRICDEMDHTLNEIGDYLHPKHLLDFVVDSVRSGSAGSTKQTVREYADRGLQSIKQHPGPALLLGGAVLWYLMDQKDEDEPLHRRASRSSRESRRSATYGAWEEDYDWSKSPEDEQTWSERAKQALEQVRSTVADASISAKDKVKAVAGHMVGASGKTREEIHAQWANLREHSGSYVDARTGEPYDDSYCEPFCSSSLEACAHISGEKSDDASWSGKAQDVVTSMTSSLQNTGASAKEQLKSLGQHLSGLVSSAGDHTGRMTSSARQGVSRGWESASGGMHSAADSARHGVHRVGDAMSHGVSQGRDQFQRAVREQPLAVGAACLGLGLLAGLLAPATKQENELMGEAADRLKDQARDMGGQAVERGKEAAAAAAGAVKKEAERQGLTPEKIDEAVRSK